MLGRTSPWYLYLLQNFSLITLSLLLLPIDTFALCFSYLLRSIIHRHASRGRRPRPLGFHPRTVLITGIGTTKGLALAREFHEAGHFVVGADFEPYGIPVNGRVSRAVDKFYLLPQPNGQDGTAYYIQELLKIIRLEGAELWISCSTIISAVEDGQAKEVIEKRSDCEVIQFHATTMTMLHDKHSFIQHTTSIGLSAPQIHDVTSRAAVHSVLNKARSKQYIMESNGTSDPIRRDMTLLPKRTVSETYNHVSRIPISPEKPWVLQQLIDGKKYCTYALVVNNEVQAFVACAGIEPQMHYEALPEHSALGQAMLKYTQEFSVRSRSGMTGHLSFNFLVEKTSTENGIEKRLYPIQCNPRAHTAVVLFAGQGAELVRKYLGASNPICNGTMANGHLTSVVLPQQPAKVYWIGQDLIALVLYPALLLLTRHVRFSDFIRSCCIFLKHIYCWKDGVYEVWDPLPWWWLYHVYWPLQLVACILQGKKWSTINVGTNEVVLC